MGKILVKEKEIVVPGQILATGMDNLPSGGAFREGDNIIASKIGLVNIENRLVKVIPLSGSYEPKRGDLIIGQVVNMSFNGWSIDLGYSNLAFLSVKDATFEFVDRKADLSIYYTFGDTLAAKITHISKPNLIDLTTKGPGLMRLKSGIVIDVTPSKVPRIIGKQGSMISIIKEKTKCRVIVGQNGKIWISGDDPKMEKKAIDAINIIERESHTDGLTNKIEKFLGE